MLGALRFIPRDSVPAVVSQTHSEADEKRGSNNKDDAAKRKHSARKERKSEHRVKSKKHKKSRKDEESSEGSSDDDDDDDVSDGPKNRTEEHQAKQEVRRKEAGLEWMTQAPERPAPVVVESEDVYTLEGEVHHQKSPSVVEPQLLQAQYFTYRPHLCLRFSELEKMPPHFWAETKLKDMDGFPIQVELVDAKTGNVVSEGVQSSATFKVVVLEGSSGDKAEADIGKGNWNELVVKPRWGRGPLLVGGLTVTLKEGKGSLDTNLCFKDNSSFVSSRKFRLGLQDISGSHIQGAVTNAFHVKDARGKSNLKKEVPAENDTLDVLVHIAKGGAPLHHLNSVLKINTVKEFNLFHKENPKALRAGLNRLSDKEFAAIIDNAARCQQEEPGLQNEADEKRGSNNKDGAAKRKHSARKERKSERRVKRKKHRKSGKDEESSEGSSADDDDDDSSDGPKNRTEEHQAKQEDRRKEAGLEWMTQAPERPAPVVMESEDVYTLEGEKPQSSVKELNPYWKSAGNGLPSEGDTGGLQKVGHSGLPPPPGVGDGGASWRLKALKRAQEQAAREGRQLDEVVEERWGSLAALTTSVAVQRAAHANSHMHAKRDRQRTSQGHDVSEGVGKADAPAEPEDEDDRRIRTSSRDYLHEVKAEGSRMKAPQADRSLSWKSKGRGGKPGMRPEDAAVFRAAAVTYNKFNDDGSFFKGLNLKSAQEEKVDLEAQISAVDETPRIVESGAVLKRESEEAPVTEHLTSISRIEVESDKRTESSGVQLQGLSTNQMAAKVMRLRLQGKHKEAEELLKQSESAAKREKEVFADAPTEEPTSRPSGVLARLEVLGQKTILSRRKTADRDLAETISRNKLYKADDEYDDYGPAAGKKQKKSAGTRETVATQGRNRIVTQHERCQWCFDNAERPKHLTIALANFTYLTLSPRRPIVPSHCFIVPMQHEGATRNVDEAVWEELRNFKKCLVRMFSEQEKEVIFLETAMHLSRMRHHCVVECIPIPASFAKEAPLYFKKAIEEAESEWSQHNSKKLIDTTGKGLRACIPKNFPYFHVEFGLNAGYVHVIDDEASFKPQFGADVIRGMLETEGIEMHGQSASLKQQQQAVRDFTKMWEPHDWTKMLD